MKLAKQYERQKMRQHDFNITAYNASKDKSEEIIKLRDQFSALSEVCCNSTTGIISKL